MLARTTFRTRAARWIELGTAASLSAALVTAVLGCSSGEPLGGPYGGATSYVAPTHAVATSSSSNALPPSEGGALGDEESDQDAMASAIDVSTAGAPTWTVIFNDYLTICQTCHNQMASAPSGYTWLRSLGYIVGTSSPLVSPSQSCLVWFGGNMPPDGADNPAAATDMSAWAAAGALYN